MKIKIKGISLLSEDFQYTMKTLGINEDTVIDLNNPPEEVNIVRPKEYSSSRSRKYDPFKNFKHIPTGYTKLLNEFYIELDYDESIEEGLDEELVDYEDLAEDIEGDINDIDLLAITLKFNNHNAQLYSYKNTILYKRISDRCDKEKAIAILDRNILYYKIVKE